MFNFGYYLLRNGRYYSGMDFTRYTHDYTKVYHLLRDLEDEIERIMLRESEGYMTRDSNDDQ